jgi:hypothetical protein
MSQNNQTPTSSAKSAISNTHQIIQDLARGAQSIIKQAEQLNRQKLEAIKKITEPSKLIIEDIQREQDETLQQFQQLNEKFKQEMDEIARAERERKEREQLRREHELSFNRPRISQNRNQPKPLPPAHTKQQQSVQINRSKSQQRSQPTTPPSSRKRRRSSLASSSDESPFVPENDMDEIVLSEYRNRPEPDKELPKVSLQKRNGKYWIGQRRFDTVLEDNLLYVKEGKERTPFSTWIERIERLEALRLKGLLSAHPLLLHQGAADKTRMLERRLSLKL